MIVKQITHKIELEGNLVGKTATFNQDNIGHIFKMLGESYSDKPGSIVREYTCNALDSHTEAKIDKKVVVSLDWKDGGYKLEFTDYGVGLSPQRMDDIFISYGSSTKRDSNTEIGGLGIGSKSAFCYTDSFYIRTVFERKEYYYIMYKGITLPTLESLYGYDEKVYEEFIYSDEEIEGEESKIIGIKHEIQKIPIGIDTEEDNGSTFTIDIESKDLTNFCNAISINLTFFENLKIISPNYTKAINLDFEHFKLSTVIHSPCILISNVIYPLNRKFIDNFKKSDFFNNTKFFEIPAVCLKFNTGDFEPTLTREDILYSDEAIDKLTQKLELVLVDFQNKIIDKNKNQFETDSYIYYKMDVKKDYVVLEGHNFKMHQSKIVEFLPFKKIGFNYLRNAGHSETSMFDYVYKKREVKNSRSRNKHTTSKAKKVVVSKHKVLDKYEKRYYEDFDIVELNRDEEKRFKRYLYKGLPNFVSKISWIYDLIKKIKAEKKIIDFKPLTEEQINEYKEENRLHKLEYGSVPANTKIVYRTRHNSIQELTYDADIKYIYSFENDIFDILDVIKKIDYKKSSFESKWVTKNKIKVYKKQKYEFVKLNDTNFKKCVKLKIKLYDLEWFFQQEPDLIRYMTSLYVLKRNYYDIPTENYDKFYNTHITFNRNKSLLADEKVKLERYNNSIMYDYPSRYRMGSKNYDFIKSELTHRFMNLDKNVGVDCYNYKRNTLLSELNYYSNKEIIDILEKYHDFKYLRECVKKVNYNMVKVPKKFKILTYFSSNAPVRFVAKNIKHLRKIKYSEIINQFKKERV